MPLRKGKQKSDKEKSSPKAGGIRFIVFLLVGTILGGGLAFGALRFFSHPDETKTKFAQSHHGPVETLDLGDKVVNLADRGSSHYLRVRVVIEYPAQKKISEEIAEKQPLLIEKVLNVFRSKKAEEVLPVRNQEKIKKEILKAVNEDLQQGKVEQVYFTDFLVQ